VHVRVVGLEVPGRGTRIQLLVAEVLQPRDDLQEMRAKSLQGSSFMDSMQLGDDVLKMSFVNILLSKITL